MIAAACHPTRGSENHFGWHAVRAMAQDHDVWAIVHENDREAIVAGQKSDGRMSGIRFCFLGEQQKRGSNRLIARIHNWLDYRRWNQRAVVLANKLHEEIGFHVAHHVTMASWRMGSPLGGTPIPFVFGPVGGGEIVPLHLFKTLSTKSAAFELLRKLSNAAGFCSSSVRRTLKKAGHIFAANAETRALMLNIGADPAIVDLLSPAFISEEYSRPIQKRAQREEMQLFCGGEIEGRKGIAVALQALKILKNRGARFHYVVGGAGAELAHLQKMVRQLELSDEVTMGRSFSGEEYRKILESADFYFLPSLRDSAPVTLLEAMAAGCIPMVCNLGGPGMMVGDIGFKVEPMDCQKMAEALADAIEVLSGDERRELMSAAIARYARETFSENNFRRRMSDTYRKIALLR